ncbi:hypothetical protein M2271_000973 [Streptomyces sp. LBL]|uniref:hypothetical protein n=1 Tax=Streptomyces sp. LBL TaxID=2940562 RepID=UPI002477011E|nr:hypothetical protein [Streptomyces sp. LBL]MDH6623186.1 hypothetical protein [Streptomyces sp. LBL]
MTTQLALTALPRPAPQQVTAPSRPRQSAEPDEPSAEGVRARVRPGLFDHITTRTRR